MKPGLPPTPPDDEALDPLLTALRQRLGDYGQAPPPAAWAAIRRRMAPPPRPWWRRPRRLLPLLALLFGVLLLGVPAGRRGQLGGTQPVAHRKAGLALTRLGHAPTYESANATDSTGYLMSPGTADSVAAGQPAAAEAKTRRATPLARRGPAALATTPDNQLGNKALAAPSVAGRPGASHRYAITTAAAGTRQPKTTLPLASNHLRRPTTETGNYAASHQRKANSQQVASPQATSRPGALLAYGRSARRTRRTAGRAATAAGETAATSSLINNNLSATNTRLHPITIMPAQLAGNQRRSRLGRAAQRASALAGSPDPAGIGAGTAIATAGRTRTAATQAAGPLGLLSFSERGVAIDSLALKRTGLLLPESARPIVSAARPDSTPPAHAGRRWSLLLLVGPTLSYRTLGPAPTLAAGHPDFARLERPAVGLGAQVQVRRVLSGRWAVAAGVGYHEYATRLALSVKDSSSYTAVRQRDTYRLLTVPVQFTYALGAPHGRLAVGLLLGTELGWYLGGRSTEGSDCGCQQRVYPTDSARTSSYRPLSLAFSLGLDLRYRLGGPASRWQLVVQPTGRYVATPFVRSDAVGFTRRQPWSLGLLTGFSWDLR